MTATAPNEGSTAPKDGRLSGSDEPATASAPASQVKPQEGLEQSRSPHGAAGFGGRTYTAKGREIFVAPLERRHADGSTGLTLGFPFATMSDFFGEEDDTATKLAEYLSCPKRAAANELYDALLELVEWSIKRGPFDEPLGSSEQEPEVNCARAALRKAGHE